MHTNEMKRDHSNLNGSTEQLQQPGLLLLEPKVSSIIEYEFVGQQTKKRRRSYEIYTF